MHVGQREKAIQDGIFWWPLGLVAAPWSTSVIQSDHPEIVSIEPGDNSAFLVAHEVGSARIHYYPEKLGNNVGFRVSVLPKE